MLLDLLPNPWEGEGHFQPGSGGFPMARTSPCND